MPSLRNTVKTDKTNKVNNYPSKLWWLFAIVILIVFVLVQLPMFWVVQKFAPNTPYLQWVSGSLWQGSATWQLPTNAQGLQQGSATTTPPKTKSPLNGTLAWQWQPLKLFIGKLSADVLITSGKSKLKGEMSTGLTGKSFKVQGLSGRIAPETLGTVLVGWQLPDAPIQVNKLSGSFAKKVGFNDVEGQLTWVGGQIGYPNAGSILSINMPTIKANLANNKDALNIHLRDENDKKLGDLQVSPAGMLDVNLTQRLLENVPSYRGSAPKDSLVFSIRQPLTSLGGQ